MIPKLIAVGATVLNAAFVESAGGSLTDHDQFGLACTGAMMTTGQKPPGSQIMADGIVNLSGKLVSGFGVGNATILSVTQDEVKFGTPFLERHAGRQVVEGTIDRLSGATHVIVRSGKTRKTTLIEMHLECRGAARPEH